VVDVPPLSLEVRDTLAPAEIAALEERLYDFNRRATGIDDGRELGVLAHDDGGALVAGLAGVTWGGCCEIRQLWVAKEHRHRGLGRRLMEAAEREARARGCAQIVLSTHDFQAPDFYHRLGYAVIAEIPDYPHGHANLVLRKRLD
jgi:ribosomal protein S18 acetylase RimI-like enzyme